MPRPSAFRAAALAAASFALCSAAAAHGIAGKRFFPATLSTDDPFVADELSLPTISTIRRPPGDENPSTTRENEIAVDWAKRITPDLGFELGEAWRNTAPKFDKPHYGFGNLEAQLKYQFYKSDEHETILSAGLGFELGGTGASQVGADRFNTLSPTLFFGKGFGDLPDSVPYLKPIAITGTLGGAIPLRSSSNKFTVNPDTGDTDVDVERHPNTLRYGIAFEYSLPYLQASVRDIGLGAPFDRLITLVELAFETPLDRGSGGKTVGTINPGVIWAGQFMQVGLEAVLPVNDRSARGVGAIFQLHFFTDDLFPTTLGRPLLGGSR
jgi:hypothetical protein